MSDLSKFKNVKVRTLFIEFGKIYNCDYTTPFELTLYESCFPYQLVKKIIHDIPPSGYIRTLEFLLNGDIQYKVRNHSNITVIKYQAGFEVILFRLLNSSFKVQFYDPDNPMRMNFGEPGFSKVIMRFPWLYYNCTKVEYENGDMVGYIHKDIEFVYTPKPNIQVPFDALQKLLDQEIKDSFKS